MIKNLFKIVLLCLFTSCTNVWIEKCGNRVTYMENLPGTVYCGCSYYYQEYKIDINKNTGVNLIKYKEIFSKQITCDDINDSNTNQRTAERILYGF